MNISEYGPGPGEGGADAAPLTCYLCTGFWNFGGGGGHGGAGETYCTESIYCAAGGTANDDPGLPRFDGQLGGGVNHTPPNGTSSNGGGLLKVVVYDPVTNQVAPATVNGTIDVSGNPGWNDLDYNYDYSGGGAGGTILIEASNLGGTGVLRADGGNATWSGGGGGGIISLIENSTSFPGTISAVGGSPGGSAGSATFTTPPLTGYY